MKRNLMKFSDTSRLSCRAALALLLVCQLARPALAADAEAGEPDVESAENQAARAYEAYVARDYDTAIRLYLEAYEAASDPDILYNIARVYDTGLRDREKAMQFYHDFVVNPNADPERVERVSIRLRALEAEGRAEPPLDAHPGASVAAPLSPAPLSPAPLSPAPLSPAPPSAAPPSAAEEAPSLAPATLADKAPRAHANGWSVWRTGALVTGGAGLVAMSVGAVFGVDALSDAKMVRRECDGNRCFSERGLSAARSAGQSADIATLSFVAGGLLVATGATLLGIDLGTSADPGRPTQTHWTAAVTTAEIHVGLGGDW